MTVALAIATKIPVKDWQAAEPEDIATAIKILEEIHGK